jgi:hypothetical protein
VYSLGNLITVSVKGDIRAVGQHAQLALVVRAVPVGGRLPRHGGGSIMLNGV